jgi:hypothetical protein
MDGRGMPFCIFARLWENICVVLMASEDHVTQTSSLEWKIEMLLTASLRLRAGSISGLLTADVILPMICYQHKRLSRKLGGPRPHESDLVLSFTA